MVAVDLSSQRRQSMHDMIEKAAKAQANDLAWVGNLYRKRLQELQKTTEQYEQWLKEQNDLA
jgi:hypothetical protein